MTARTSLRERLLGLARFLPAFESPAFEFARWVEPPVTESGVRTMPYEEHSDTAIAFVSTAEALGWVKPDLKWAQWQRTPEASRLIAEPGVLERADASDLACLLTWAIRHDRFTEGGLAELYKSGLLTRILRRAATLADEMTEGRPEGSHGGVYTRPTNQTPLTKAEKSDLLTEYVTHYRRVAERDPQALNRKLERDAFAEVLDRVGALLLEASANLADSPGVVRTFLDENPLPEGMASRLPDDFRAFCLALNALKQWLAKEQAATDRYLLGGVSRQMCRAASQACLVTGLPLAIDAELHHPVRDGRPPVLLSKAGHDQLEGQEGIDFADDVGKSLVALRRKGNRSWVQLRNGCLDLLGQPTVVRSKAMASNGRSFARSAKSQTGLSYQDLLDWLDKNGLGEAQD